MSRGVLIAAMLAGCTACSLYAQAAAAPPPPSQQADQPLLPQDQAAVIRTLLARSRMLEDVNFRVPLRVWEDFLRDSLAPGGGSAAPVPAIVEEGQYRLQVDPQGVGTLQVRLQVRFFDLVRCPRLGLLAGKLNWQSVSIDKKPASLPTVKDWLVLAPREPGVYVLTARADIKLPGKDSFSLALPAAPAVRTLLEFESDSAWEVSAAGAAGLIVGSTEKGTHGQLALGRPGVIDVAYGPVRPAVVHAPHYQLRGDVAWNLQGGGGAQVSANLEVNVIGQSELLELTLPPKAARVNIAGPQVRQVQLGAERAQVFLRGQVSGRVPLTVDFELPTEGQSLRLPSMAVSGGAWAGGCLVVASPDSGSEILAGAVAGLTELALPDVPSSAMGLLTGPPALAWQIAGRQWEGQVELLNLGELALRDSIADLAHYELLFQPDGATMCKATYELRNRTRQFMRVDLPPGSQVLLAKVNEKSLPPSPLDGAPDAYLLPLVRSRASVKGMTSFPVELVFVYRTDKLRPSGAARVTLPRVDLPIAYAWCEAYMPWELELERWSGPMANVQRYSSETALAQLAYGSGELAEGYNEKSRPRVALAGPAAPVASPNKKGSSLLGAIFEPMFAQRSMAIPMAAHAPVRPDAPSPTAGEAAKPASQPSGGPEDLDPAARAQFARNYARAGQEAYDNNDYNGARASLERVKQLAPNTPEADNAERLLANIRLAQGQGILEGKSQKIAGKLVQKEMQSANTALRQQQQKLLGEGLEAARQGKDKLAQTQLRVANDLSRKLVQQGEDTKEQQALLRQSQDELKRLGEKQVAENERLREDLSQAEKAGDYQQAMVKARQLQETADSPQEQRELAKKMNDYVVVTNTTWNARISLPKEEPSTAGTALPIVSENIERAQPRMGSYEYSRAASRPTDDGWITGPINGTKIVSDSGSSAFLPQWTGQPSTSPYIPQSHTIALPPQESSMLVSTDQMRHELIALRDQGKYADAVEIAARLKEFDPTDTWATEQYAVLSQFLLLMEDKRASGENRLPAEIRESYKMLASQGEGPEMTLKRQSGGLGKGGGNGAITKVYDIRDLTIRRPNFVGSPIDSQRFGNNAAGNETSGGVFRNSGSEDQPNQAVSREELVQEIKGTVESVLGREQGSIREMQGILVISGDEAQQQAAARLLEDLRQARGPAVARGERLAEQEATRRPNYIGPTIELQGTLRQPNQIGPNVNVAGGSLDGIQADFFVQPNAAGPTVQVDPELNRFIERNYDWANGRGGGPQAGSGPIMGVPIVNKLPLTSTLMQNLGQKVVVNSTNVNADANAAARLGVKFEAGQNNLRLGLADEGQVRTLLEQEARRRADAQSVPANDRLQETIVGTDALLANGMTLNESFAEDRGNWVDIRGNSIRLAHEKYVLIDNGGYLTVVRAGPMQHWTQAPADVRFPEVPQDIPLPHVGRLAKFEKTLVKPREELVIEFTYVWKGPEQ